MRTVCLLGYFLRFSDHVFCVEQPCVFGMLSLPKTRVEGDVVVADFEVFARSDDGDFPPDAVDDEPMADLLPALVDSLE